MVQVGIVPGGRRFRLFATSALVGGALAAGSWAAPAMAQERGGARGSLVLEEIIVTSQKREERLQDVPVSVTAFSGDAVRSLGFTNSVDIAAQTPGLQIGTPVGEGNNPSITLRGVGLNDFNDNNEGPVAVYIDEIYLGSLAGQTFQLFDLERIEVLRGPQGTLYGRNSTGGLMHFISKRPSREVELSLDASYGRYNEVKVEGAVSGPLTEAVQARLAVAYNRSDGYVKNRFDGSHRNEKNNIAFRFMTNFDLSEDATLLLNVHGAKSDVLAPVYQHQGSFENLAGGSCTTAEALAGQCVDAFGYRDADGDPFAGSYDRKGKFTLKTIGGSGTFNWDFADGLTLTAISSYDKVKKFHQEDTDMSPFDRIDPTFQLDAWQITEEVRVAGKSDRLDWVVGGYFYYQKVHMPQELAFGVDLDPTFDLDTLANQKTSSLAAFGQAEYKVFDGISVLLGGRYTKERKTYDYTQIDKLGGVAGLPPGTPLPGYPFNEAIYGDLAKFDKGIFSGKAGINWKPNDDVLAFVSVARGFKSGGFNAGFTSAAPDRLKYNEEKLTAYEIGVKSTLFDNRARFNVTGFYYDYKNLQALTFDQFSSFITNAADATVKGAEFELATNPFTGLDVNFGLSLLDAKANGLRLPDGEIVDDRHLVLAPKVSLNALVRYTHSFASGASLAGQVDMSYQSSHFFDIFNQPLSESKGYDIWNARIAYTFPDDKFEIAAWGKNIFNKKYLVYTFDFTNEFGFNQLFYGLPAWYGLTLSYRY